LPTLATGYGNINNISSNEFWTNPQISENQVKQLIKFRTNQYMGNVQKHLFWPLRYPSITCSLCTTNKVDTWPHVLFSYPQPHLHALRVKRHNKAVWEIRKLLLSLPLSRCLILMNAGYLTIIPQTIQYPLAPAICLLNPKMSMQCSPPT
jgi:hypothetical protein